MSRREAAQAAVPAKPRLYRRLVLFGCGLLILASLGLLVWLGDGSGPLPGKAGNDANATVTAGTPEAAGAAAVNPASGLPAEEQRLGVWLQARYGSKLAHPYWRLQVIESLKRYLMEKYPNDWQARLTAMLKQFFPADYDKLMASFEALESYNEWLAEIKHSMTFSSKEERLRATWDKRLQLFGEDAKVIWQAQLKQEKVEAALQQLDTPGLPLSTKVDRYVQTLVDIYGTDATNPDKSHPVQQMEGLLALNTVQDQLHSLPPERRKEELHHLRSALGLDAEAVKRWDELDAERAQRAAAGASYMQERAALEKQYQGEALQVQIQALQNRKFGPEEAQYIRNEEETGFYRYQERQQIGVN
ncbi:MAG TPA: hypothetical protein VFW42_02180 [Fluviicoccus sp.]|nr:hypothetical protein [Fluviicoccus sp.]